RSGSHCRGCSCWRYCCGGTSRASAPCVLCRLAHADRRRSSSTRWPFSCSAEATTPTPTASRATPCCTRWRARSACPATASRAASSRRRHATVAFPESGWRGCWTPTLRRQEREPMPLSTPFVSWKRCAMTSSKQYLPAEGGSPLGALYDAARRELGKVIVGQDDVLE